MPRPRNKETDEVAKKLDVTKRRAEQLKKEGITAGEVDEKRALTCRKLEVEIAKLEAQLAKFNREVISHAEAKAYGLQIAQVMEQHWDEILINWPTEHAGKTELQLKQVYDKASIEYKNRLREAVENI